MPVPLVAQAWQEGITSVPGASLVLKTLPWLALLYVIKWYSSGASNGSERTMHGKVVMITGGTSGIGAEIARELAERGAQIVLLTQHALTDVFLADYIGELRTRTGNELINAVQVDLSSLHSIRAFATQWIDNAPPRRLDTIILCANTLTPRGCSIKVTDDDVEENWQLNYLANFHLLSILSPAIRAQPPDRDVRIVFGACSSYIRGELPVEAKTAADEKDASEKSKKKSNALKPTPTSDFNPASAYATSKLALITFALAFQKHLNSYDRPDKQPVNTRILLADPGLTRTPGTRRYLSWGSISGLLLYVLMYPFWWLVLKSPIQGAQTFLYAAMEAQYGRGDGGWYVRECRESVFKRKDVHDEGLQQALWEYSENMVQEAEKRGAKRRAEVKKEEEAELLQKKREEEKAKAQPAKAAGSRRSRKA